MLLGECSKYRCGLLVLGAPRYTVSPEWFDELKGFFCKLAVIKQFLARQLILLCISDFQMAVVHYSCICLLLKFCSVVYGLVPSKK